MLIGRAYRETGFLAESIDEFKKAIALDAKFPRVHYYLGLTYLYKDGAARIPDAMEEFKIELAANPDEYFANFYLGILYIMDRKWEPAIALLEKATRKQPNNPDPYFHLGQAYQGAGKHKEAVEVLQKTIALNPSLGHNDYQVTTAHYRLGQSLMKVGRTEEGEKELQISADLKSKGFKLDEKKVGAFLSGNNLPDQIRQVGISESRRRDCRSRLHSIRVKAEKLKAKRLTTRKSWRQVITASACFVRSNRISAKLRRSLRSRQSGTRTRKDSTSISVSRTTNPSRTKKRYPLSKTN